MSKSWVSYGGNCGNVNVKGTNELGYKNRAQHSFVFDNTSGNVTFPKRFSPVSPSLMNTFKVFPQSWGR